MVARRLRDLRLGRHESREVLLGKHLVLPAVLAQNDDLSLRPDEDHAPALGKRETFRHGLRGQKPPVVPGQRQGGETLAAGGEGELHGARLGARLRNARLAQHLDARRRPELQAPVGAVEDVATHVAQRAVAEVPPAPPVEGMVDLLDVGPLGRGPEPEVPVEVLGHGRRGRRPQDALRPGRVHDPRVHFGDGADDAGAQQLDRRAASIRGVALVAHLGRDLRLRRRLCQKVRLVDRMAEGLLAVDVFPHLHRHHRRRGMDVVGGADHDRIDILLILEHPAEVRVPAGAGMDLRRLVQVPGVDVAERDDVLARDAFQVRRAAPGNADAGDVQCVVGGGGGPREPGSRARRGGAAEEVTTGEVHGTSESALGFRPWTLGIAKVTAVLKPKVQSLKPTAVHPGSSSSSDRRE